MTTIALKVDKRIIWDWREIFWAFWIAFSIMIGLSFGVCIMLLSKICYLIFGEKVCHEIKGLLWFFIITIGLTINSCLLVIGIIEYFDSSTIYSSGLIMAFYSIISNLLLLIIYTILFKKDINLFLERLSHNQEDNF